MPTTSSGPKKKLPRGTMVIGGGIAGIQAALDLAEAGIITYLVERTPSIGGRMAQLDKTFPTNDCAMCILSPKLVAVARHPNIHLFTNSEITSVSGGAGNFQVKVIKHPRFIDENKCVGCGECATKCPVKVPFEFEFGLAERRAIYVPFPQAVPLVYTIDSEHCKYLQNGKCGICAKICKADAVDYEQKPEHLTLDIGSIIVATGYDQFDPSALKELGYGIHKNVITGLEFERLLNASGPTQGKILRRSDRKTPKNIVFIQCVGSRDKNRSKEYCSRICCMYTVKEAMIAREHQPDLDQITIIGMEIRAYGKGFEEYYQRAMAEGITFIKGHYSDLTEDPESGKVLIRFEDLEAGKINEISADLVVLSSAVVPNTTNEQLSKILDIELDEHGFFKERPLPDSAILSTREGILLSGCAQGPKDIPDSVAQGSGAAAIAAGYLSSSDHHSYSHSRSDIATTSKNTKHDIDMLDTEPRTGVFVCHCGINIAGVLDVPALVRYAKKLPNVVFATDNLYTCSDDAQRIIQDMIKEHELTRVVVASCTPRTHEPIFKDTCARAGLNPYLFEMTNIRDQCSWVHMNEPAKATEKAKDLIRMAVARANELAPLETISTPINQSVLVIGGGIAGMECASSLANQGIKTTLVEMQPQLGGRLNELNKLAHSDRPISELLDKKIRQLKRSGVKIHLGYKPVAIKGYVGNFDVTLSHETNKTSKSKQIELNTGAIVLAIGSELYKPELAHEFGYGKYPNVITNLELDKHLKENKLGTKTTNIVFIQCVGARQIDGPGANTGCSRYCCQTTLHQAIELVKLGRAVTVLHRGIRAFGKYAEELYYEACGSGVNFIQFPDALPPKPSNKGSKTKIKVHDISLGQEVKLSTDLLVLTLGMIPNLAETEVLQKLLKIPRSADGFFMELHPKLAPVETNTTGIYLCGCAQGPKDVIDSLNQAHAAAAKVGALVSNEELSVEPITSTVDEQICWGCGTCEDLCEFGAIRIEVSADGRRVSQVNSALCKGCGVCASNCPSGAMTIRHFTNIQISCMIKAFGEVTN